MYVLCFPILVHQSQGKKPKHSAETFAGRSLAANPDTPIPVADTTEICNVACTRLGLLR